MHHKKPGREEYNVGIIISTSAIVSSAGESIQLAHRLPGLVVKCEVKTGDLKGPMGLPPIELLGSHEVFEVFVIHPDLTGVFRTFSEVPPVL